MYAKYGEVPKSSGGLKGGSLDRLVQQNLLSGISEAQSSRLRAQQRLDLLDSIRDNGYKPSLLDPIYGVRKVGSCELFLQGGHHRVAVLGVLGEFNDRPIPSVLERLTFRDASKSSR
jgi:hypothetical protein